MTVVAVIWHECIDDTNIYFLSNHMENLPIEAEAAHLHRRNNILEDGRVPFHSCNLCKDNHLSIATLLEY